jgi:hypothetical protein
MSKENFISSSGRFLQHAEQFCALLGIYQKIKCRNTKKMHRVHFCQRVYRRNKIYGEMSQGFSVANWEKFRAENTKVAAQKIRSRIFYRFTKKNGRKEAKLFLKIVLTEKARFSQKCTA